jgi:hypothetical protein
MSYVTRYEGYGAKRWTSDKTVIVSREQYLLPRLAEGIVDLIESGFKCRTSNEQHHYLSPASTSVTVCTSLVSSCLCIPLIPLICLKSDFSASERPTGV